jgi:uncharacterized protein (TIGR03083 family)
MRLVMRERPAACQDRPVSQARGEGQTQRVYLLAVDGFRDLVASIDPVDFGAPGLGEWTVREVIGHTSRALTTVEDDLRQGGGTVDIPDSLDYLRRGHALRARHPELDADIAERGRAAAAELGANPAAAVAELARRVAGIVAAASPDAVVRTRLGGMTLTEYLPTRTFELAVHGADLAAATGQPLPRGYGEPLLAAGELTIRLADARGQLPLVLRALLGRTSLPVGFCLI